MPLITTGNAATAWHADVIVDGLPDLLPDVLHHLAATTVFRANLGDAQSVLIPWVGDVAAAFVAEGDEITETSPALSQVAVATGRLSILSQMSNEQFRQLKPNDRTLELGLVRNITEAANTAFLTQAAPTAPAITPPAGILNTPGIVNGGKIADNLDALADGLGTLETNKARPGIILAAPDAWARLRKFKTDTDSNESLVGAGTAAGPKTLFDIPVVTTPAMPTGQLLVVDPSIVAAVVGPLEVAYSDIPLWAKYSTAIRITWRIGQVVTKPNRIAKFTVAAPTA